MSSCKHCSSAFEVTSEDLAFYDKMSPVFAGGKQPIPAPLSCPACRQRQRFSFRNERKLYHRKCDLSGKQLVSLYSADKPQKVYAPAVWWSDAYDPLAYGREFDFSRPFFAQFAELNLAVPKAAIHNAKSENCDYTNYSAENKDCYLVVGGLGAEDCLYGYRVFYSKDVVDSYDVIKCERCYECLESSGLYGCAWCHNCHTSSDLFLCIDLSGCNDCFGCVGLRNKKFHIYNIAYGEEEYRGKLQELRRAPDMAAFEQLRASVPHRATQALQCEDSTGDQLLQCKNCHDCYTLKHSQDCAHSAVGENDKDCRDANFFDNCELQYFCSNLEKNYHCAFCMLAWYCKECFYVMNSFNSSYLFGCSGMKKHQYCILNKQYTKEEYEVMVPKIIAHMRSTGEWGEFFPSSISPFAYNETIAQEWYPMSESEAKAQGLKWQSNEEETEKYLGPDAVVPADIQDVSDEVIKRILRCSVTGKPFKIIPQELALYRSMNLPVPTKCPDQRHAERMSRINPRCLWERQCARCSKDIQTSYHPDRSELIYCDECYLASIY